jgi:acylphosphatase
MKTVHIIIQGVVQGVYFRQYTKEQADMLHLTGWVRNLANGNVEILATGDEKILDQFIKWCHEGSPRAVVNKVEVQETPLNNFTSFEIQRR